MTLEELLEKEAIKELRSKYSHYYDGMMIDKLVDLFTDDAICEFGPDFGGDWVGKEAIRTNFTAFSEMEGIPYGVFHAITNPIIKLIDDTTAHGRWYLHDLITMEEVENPHVIYGIYDDVYKKVSGEWKFYRTRIDFLWPQRQVGSPREF
jgi:hypothetical protein